MSQKILLLGAGPIAIEYSKIIQSLGHEFVVVGRGSESAKTFETATNHKVLLGGIEANLEVAKSCSKAIVATSEDTLDSVTLKIIDLGIKHILVEKPGSKDFASLSHLASHAQEKKAQVYIAYNRRFFQSVKALKEMIVQDGGLESMHFEFTEWSHVIAGIQKNEGVKENWLWHNSSHVIDLAFYLAGNPEKMNTFKKDQLDWHPAGKVFVGAGLTENNVLFSYHANWGGPGRWSLELITSKNRYYLKPIEELQIQKLGTVKVDLVELDNSLDKNWKPGYYLQTQAFLNSDYTKLQPISEQNANLEFYKKILLEK